MLALQSIATCFESLSSPGGSSLLIGQLLNAAFGNAKISRQWNMARADQIAAATLDAVHQAELTQFVLIVGTGVPEQLLWQ